jgi:hypothetical protein
MISSFMEGLRQFFRALQVWVTIAPWEQGLRVRLGQRVKLLRAGIHLKLPIIDVLYIQTVRARISALGRQIAATRDGKAVTLSGAVGYAIDCQQHITLFREHLKTARFDGLECRPGRNMPELNAVLMGWADWVMEARILNGEYEYDWRRNRDSHVHRVLAA